MMGPRGQHELWPTINPAAYIENSGLHTASSHQGMHVALPALVSPLQCGHEVVSGNVASFLSKHFCVPVPDTADPRHCPRIPHTDANDYQGVSSVKASQPSCWDTGTGPIWTKPGLQKARQNQQLQTRDLYYKRYGREHPGLQHFLLTPKTQAKGKETLDKL